MTHCSLLTSLLVMFFMSFSLYAVNDPETVIGAEKYDKVMCIEQYTDNCINSVCMTSDDIDCQEKCKQMAEDKCKEQTNE